ncbi:MAG: hypothetical protein LBU95_01120 [Rikenellaceae bacterium]|jgi:thiamine pyrophosphate-dependent acetolactate synthase large subunit-like protein|nr:hypothetical protein [Rikenellaceae bacterium]
MEKTVKSGTAMLRVLESWGGDHIYGRPGGSINSTMNALWDEQSEIRYIQVRHEEVGVAGYTVTDPGQLADVFDKARESKLPVVIDIKIGSDRPFPAEAMVLDEAQFGREAVEAFKKRYEVRDMPTLVELLG